MATSLKHWISLALILAASASYLSLDLRHHDWSFDDDNYIEDARMAQSRFSHVFSPDKAGAGRPTVHLYFYALFPIFEEDPGKYHVANLFVHAANAFLLATLVHRLGANFWVAASTGLLFYFSLSHFRAILWISGIGQSVGGLPFTTLRGQIKKYAGILQQATADNNGRLEVECLKEISRLSGLDRTKTIEEIEKDDRNSKEQLRSQLLGMVERARSYHAGDSAKEFIGRG